MPAKFVLLLCAARAAALWSKSAAVPPMGGTDGGTMVATSTGALLFGGLSAMPTGDGGGGSNAFNAVHSFTGNSWQTLNDGTGSGAPGGRWRLCATFHPAQQTMYVFFGASTTGETVLPDAWAFSLADSSWSLAFSSNATRAAAGLEPVARHSHTCVARGETAVLYGGATAAGAIFGDIWGFNTTSHTWHPIPAGAVAAAPSGRLAHTAAYAASIGLDAMVIHGGLVSAGGNSVVVSSDLFVLSFAPGGNGSVPLLGTWQAAATSGASPARAFAGQAVLVSAQAALCVFGGFDASGDITQADSLVCVDASTGFGVARGSGSQSQRQLRLLPAVAGTTDTGAQSPFPALPSPSPAPPPAAAPPAWLQLVGSAPTPPARQRHAAVELPAATAAVWATSAGLPALAAALAALAPSAGSGVLMLAAGNGASSMLSDAWLVDLPALSAGGAWSALAASQGDLGFYFVLLQYLAYGVGLTVCSITCFVCIVRRAVRNARGADQRGGRRRGGGGDAGSPQGGEDGGGIALGRWGTLAGDREAAAAARSRLGGVAPETIQHLPTIVFVACRPPPPSLPPATEKSLSAAVPAAAAGTAAKGVGVTAATTSSCSVADGGGGVAAAAAAATALTISASLEVTATALPAATEALTRQPEHQAAFNPDEQTCCAICLGDYADGDVLRILPCMHRYHAPCADRWLAGHRTCPLCKDDVLAAVV